MTKTDYIFWMATALLIAFVTLSIRPAYSGERVDIFNNRGERQGYAKPSPYSERCCVVYDQKGERLGYIRPQRQGVEGRPVQTRDQNAVQSSRGKR